MLTFSLTSSHLSYEEMHGIELDYGTRRLQTDSVIEGAYFCSSLLESSNGQSSLT